MTLLSILRLIIKIVFFVLFCLLTGFVFVLGKSGTGIKLYYGFTSALLWGVILL